ncbi:MAG: hypothetical protein K2F69_05740 [Bacteroidaceae bacterium]|nr:hypothetical protein [Bacteroidaceae bacterium]
MKLEKISNIVLLALVAVILVSFALFYFVGYDDLLEGTDMQAPKNTGLLLYMQYTLFVITAVAMVYSFVYNALKSSGSDIAKSTGLPANMVFYGTFGFAIASLVIGYILGMGSAEPIVDVTGAETTSAVMVNVVDMFLYSIYILSLAAFVAVGVSLSGILKK